LGSDVRGRGGRILIRTVADVRVVEFVAGIIGQPFIGTVTALGVERDGEIIGGAVFSFFTRYSLHVTVAGSGFTKGFLADVGHYVFGHLKRLRITVVTEQPRVVRIAERLGGTVTGYLPDEFGEGRDGIVVSIRKDDYRY